MVIYSVNDAGFGFLFSVYVECHQHTYVQVKSEDFFE